MSSPLTVVISQSQSKNPVKRELEEGIISTLSDQPGIGLLVVPHLYDIKPDSDGMSALKGVSGDMIVCSWLFERPIRWVLDRNGIAGQEGEVLLTTADEDEDEEESKVEEKERVLDTREIPDRKIFCLDLKAANKPRKFVEEIKRIQEEEIPQPVTLADVVSGSINGNGDSDVARFENKAGRRWYPVIDYSRCTNCMECIDFCLFGVYGVDRIDTILVEQPDNCRKGCPACSRVCPENAIMFPQHKTPAIAGSNESASSLKIDLSQLFGAPTDKTSAVELAAAERDEQLELAGRDKVGMTVGIAKRQPDSSSKKKDDLDNLVDQLDELDL